MKTELEKFYSLIDEIKVAMMTTRRADGHLESRAMANQKRAAGADLWFVTAAGQRQASGYQRRPTREPVVLQRRESREWVSVSGIATISRDRAKIRELYAPDWKAWFGRKATRATARPTIRGWCSSASMSMRRCSSR